MRDTLLKFGEATAATKATEVYCADVIDLGQSEHIGNLDNLNIVIAPQTDMASVDNVVVKVYTGSTSSPSTLILTGPTCTALAQGEQVSIPFPKTNERYMKIGILPGSTGTFTSTKFDAWIQFGQK